jgi:hypothetical protein
MEQLKKRAHGLRQEIAAAFGKLKLDSLAEEKLRLQADMKAPDFWQDNLKATATTKNAAAHVRPLGRSGRAEDHDP